MAKVKITIYYTPECPKDPVVSSVSEALKEAGIDDYEIEDILLANDEEACRHKVLGIPTVRVNGVDVDPTFKDIGKYTSACSRVYKWEGKYYSVPPKEMILDAFKRLGILK
ncbi:MAG: DUF2703 domain-containing protein [Candidatus Korarchaeota archaeon]|nr:DUF2703 domain-containing protein [Candidatus Korarchaeota archaeon]